MAHLQAVIVATVKRGAGIQPDPVREVTQYWSTEGTLLAESDPCAVASDDVIAALAAVYDSLAYVDRAHGADITGGLPRHSALEKARLALTQLGRTI